MVVELASEDCGIATYSAEPAEALSLEGNEMHIVCHPDGGAPGEKNVYPVLDTDHHGWDEAVYDTVKSVGPDHAVYQWAYLHTNLGRIVDNV